MRIGYAVQGSTDRAFLTGLKERWCRDAELVEGSFRGSTGLSLRRELAKICKDLFDFKGCDLLVFLSDADEQEWGEVQKNEIEKLPENIRPLTVYAIVDRNVECWLCADEGYIAGKVGRSSREFVVDNPKGIFESAMGITRDYKREKEIADLVQHAPLENWMERSPSFKCFYEQLWQVSKNNHCQIENLWERR